MLLSLWKIYPILSSVNKTERSRVRRSTLRAHAWHLPERIQTLNHNRVWADPIVTHFLTDNYCVFQWLPVPLVRSLLKVKQMHTHWNRSQNINQGIDKTFDHGMQVSRIEDKQCCKWYFFWLNHPELLLCRLVWKPVSSTSSCLETGSAAASACSHAC